MLELMETWSKGTNNTDLSLKQRWYWEIMELVDLGTGRDGSFVEVEASQFTAQVGSGLSEMFQWMGEFGCKYSYTGGSTQKRWPEQGNENWFRDKFSSSRLRNFWSVRREPNQGRVETPELGAVCYASGLVENCTVMSCVKCSLRNWHQILKSNSLLSTSDPNLMRRISYFKTSAFLEESNTTFTSPNSKHYPPPSRPQTP